MLQRVTAGLPALTPLRRAGRDTQLRTRALSDACLSEEREREAAAVAPDGGVDVTNLEAQIGRPLATTEVVARLGRMNRNLWFERAAADPSKMGVYVIEQHERRFICGMEAAFQPEFSIRHFEQKEVPDRTVPGHWQKVRHFIGETRGWRTVLARLLRERLITEPQIEMYFGVAGGRSSANWQALTQ